MRGAYGRRQHFAAFADNYSVGGVLSLLPCADNYPVGEVAGSVHVVAVRPYHVSGHFFQVTPAGKNGSKADLYRSVE